MSETGLKALKSLNKLLNQADNKQKRLDGLFKRSEKKLCNRELISDIITIFGRRKVRKK